MAEKTEIESLTDALHGARSPFIVSAAGERMFLVTPRQGGGWDVARDLLENAHSMIVEAPPRVAASVTLQTQDSLVDYVVRFKNDETMLFANIAKSSIVAIVDYHGAPVRGPDVEETPFPDHCSHKASLELPFSEEWSTWKAKSGALLPQLEFARFLEENGADVAAPDGADLLEICRDLQAHRKVNFVKAVRTATDHENFEWKDETEAKSAKGGIEVPTKFLLRIPVYFGEPETELYAFLRWKLEEGGLLLGYVLHRAEHVRQAVFKQIMLDVGQRTGRPVLFGVA